MFKKPKKIEKEIELETDKGRELNDDELEKVTGGSLKNKPKTGTSDISDDTKDNI